MNNYRVYSTFILGVMALILLLCGSAFSGDRQLPIQDHRVAIDIANRVSGFDQLPNFSEITITVQKVIVAEDNTVLYEWIEGRSFWKVSYFGVIVENEGERNPYINAFDVFVDVETGQVPKIVSQWKHGIDPKYKEAKRKDNKGKKHRREKKQYTLPEALPRISFLEVYKKWIDSKVKHIEVVYMYDYDRNLEVLVPVLYVKTYGGKVVLPAICNIQTAYSAPVSTHDSIRVTLEHLWIHAVTGEEFRKLYGSSRIE